MCLLVVVSRLDPGAPLVVGANRDEQLERPATSMTVLRAERPRILGGRDEQAGGTWLAVNEHGVVAGLTNRPSPEGRDPTRRSRGELPLALAAHRDAPGAVAEFAARFHPSDYNAAWLLVGDRSSLYYVDMTAGDQPEVEALPPGVHILENNPLHGPSDKVDHVRALLGEGATSRGGGLVDSVRTVLVDHSAPRPAPGTDPRRPADTLAACVHTDTYGTRSSSVVRVPADGGERPSVLVTDGHPCRSDFVSADGLWSAGPGGAEHG